MGVYVELKVAGHSIPEKEWGELFDETLTLLRAREAIGRRREKVTYEGMPEAERIVYSKNIEHDIHTPDKQHWHVVGDAQSLLTAESFIMHRSRQRFGAFNPSENSPDVILDMIREVEDDDMICHTVFGAKTQGYPYHFLMLAVGMLAEDRFPEYAVVSGNIDRYQAIKAQEIIREELGKEVALPVVTEWTRLIARIKKYRSDVAAIRAFDLIVRDEPRRDGKARYQAIAENFTPQVFHQWVLRELKHYSSPTQIGAKNISIDWLNTGFDVKTLVELACIHEAGPQFDPVDFGRVLVGSLWLTVDPEVREHLKAFRKPEGEVDRVMTQFGNAMFDLMGAKGRSLEAFRPLNQLLEDMGHLFPERIEQLRQVVTEAHTKATSELTTIGEVLKKTITSFETTDDDIDPLMDGTDIFYLEETDRLNESCTLLLTSVAFAIHIFQKNIEADERLTEIFVTDPSIHKCRLVILKILQEQGPVLSDTAWRWIDQEEDFKLIKSLAILSLTGHHHESFYNAKKSVFEKRWLCKLVTEWASDADKMNGVREMVEKVQNNP